MARFCLPLRFSLRTMLLLVAVASALLAWVGYSLRWIKERNDWRDNAEHVGFFCMNERLGSDAPTTAPGLLWVFGVEGFGAIWCLPEQFETVRRIFPEADIEIGPM